MEEILKKANREMAVRNNLVPETATYEEAKEAIRNPDNFAKRLEESNEEISPGVFLHAKTIELEEDHFCNVYEVVYQKQNTELTTQILTRQQPLYAHRVFKNAKGDRKPLACINGPFFFLQDEILEKVPSEIIYNLNISDGQVKGLPAVDRMALVSLYGNGLEAREIKANGSLKIGSVDVNWVGGEPFAHGKEKYINHNVDAILFNSACCTIQYENPEDKTSLRKLRRDLNKTPKNEGYSDIVVSLDQEGFLRVTKINSECGTDFFEGNFILHIKNSHIHDIKINDIVSPETLDGIEVKNIQSGVTTGPDVKYFIENKDHEINHDPSLGTFPPFSPNARYARSVMYEDLEGSVHMVVFDAVPRSTKMKGVTPKEVADNIPKDSKWAIFLDGGQSSRVTFVHNKEGETEIDSRGNQQYVRLHERYKTSQNTTDSKAEDQFLWTRRGRPLSSMIVLYQKN